MSPLEIDVGNSFIKWRFAGGSVSRVSRSESLETVFSSLMLKAKPTDVWISSVAAEDFNHRLFCFCRNRFAVSAKFAEVKNGVLGLTLAYAQPKKLGVDRWLAMLAARARSEATAIMVVDIGTAITVDVMRGRQHLGGMIVPGVDLLTTSLVKNTAGIDVSKVSLSKNWRLGKSTLDCVQSGLGVMLSGFFDSLIEQYVASGEVEQVFWCGGGAEVVASVQNIPGEVCPDLVLDGLQCVFANSDFRS